MPPWPRPVSFAWRPLLSDGGGPIYAPGGADELDNALTMAARWLDPEE